MFEKLEETIKEICQKCEVRLYDIDVINIQKGVMLRVYITKVNGVSINDCSIVAKELNTMSEGKNEYLKDFLNIEVSSPGVERVLKFKKHYASSINETLRIQYLKDGSKETMIGKLIEVNSDTIMLEDGPNRLSISFQSIKRAKTYVLLNEKKKRSDSRSSQKRGSKEG
ncbi:MAG: hypothetical protein FWG20_04420 [Candidatus Cloacimonetes bacterium]|nr:hypothetical protein [Candidatus Cloacimonadota bacterium]